MKRRLGILTGFLILAGCLVASMIAWSDSSTSLGRENGISTTINVWLYDQELEPLLEQYEKEHTELSVNIRIFRSWDSLYEELLKAISANNAPHIAEIASTYGVAQLIERDIVRPAVLTEEALGNRIAEPFAAAFSYEGRQWAVPVGGSVPVIYSNRELFHAAHAGEAPMDWAAVKRAGSMIVKDVDGDGKTDIWGLAADPDMAWVHMNASYDTGDSGWDRARLLDSFERWRDYVNGSRLMPPLQHELAASQFIYGKVGMLVSSSHKRTVLEKYIGGKFDLDITPLPRGDRDAKLLLDARGLAVMASDAEAETLSHAVVGHMLDERVQARLMREVSLIPARVDVAEALLRSADLTAREREVLQMAELLAAKQPQEDDELRWRSYTVAQEKLETYPDGTVNVAP